MKKMILAAVMMVASTAAFAQISIKPMIGVTGANITNFDDASMKIGGIVGAEVEAPINDMFSVTAGALFSMEGTKYEYGSNTDMNVNLDYINVPVLINAYVAPGLAVKLGIQPGFNVYNKLELNANGNKVEKEFSDGVNTVDLAMPIGLSYEINKFVIDARYNLGLTNAFKDDQGDHKNSVFQLTLGYKF